MKKQSGMSLSEVLVSLFLSSFIMTLLTQFYLNSKHLYIEAEEVLAENFDLQWANDLLSDSIRRAGFTPCLGIDQLNLKQNGVVVRGLTIENEPRPLIQVNRMSEHFVSLVSVANSTQLVVSPGVSFHEKRSVMIADCEHAEVHNISSVEGSVIHVEKPLQFKYSKSAYVGEFIKEQWFIKNNALYYKLNQAEEVTSLIHSLSMHNQREHGKPFIEVIMSLADGKTRKLLIAVRGS